MINHVRLLNMKSFVSLAPMLELLAVGTLLVACSNSEARFAKEIPGVWQGTPETFSDNSAITASIIDTYEFSPASMSAHETLAGAVTVSGMVNVTTQVVDSAYVEPVQLSVAAHTTISGTWTVVDDDEIALNLDVSSIMVEVDPKAVAASDIPAVIGSPAAETVNPEMRSRLVEGIKLALSARYASMRHMNDVEVKGVLLKYEMHDEDFVLTRQSE